MELLFVLSVVRLLIPWDNPYAKIIGSERIYPFIQDKILLHQIVFGLNIGQILLVIWGIGSIVLFCHFVYGMLQEIRQIRKRTESIQKWSILQNGPMSRFSTS